MRVFETHDGGSIPSGPANDFLRRKKMKRVIEIRAAEGGDDSKLFVKDLAQAYRKFAERKG